MSERVNLKLVPRQCKIEFVRNKLTADEMLIQLAEECNELAQACLKVVRMGSGNPPKKTPKEMDSAFEEELADVQLCIEILPEFVREESELEEIKEYKLNRWVQRLNGDYSE